MKTRRILGIVLAFVMIITNINIALAKEQINENTPATVENINTNKTIISDEDKNTIYYSFNLGNGAEIRIEEDSNKRIAGYYTNNTKKQISIFDKVTGDIYYYDLNQQPAASSIRPTDENVAPEPYVQKYNIQDFLLTETGHESNSQAAANDDDGFDLIKSKEVSVYGEIFQRELYGYTDSKQYRQNSWHFPANTAVSVIAAACGFLPQVGVALSIVATAAGLVLSAFTVQEWVKELFWVYKFKQTSPTKMEFVCSGEFMYEKQHKVEINGDIGYWETLETKSDKEIERVRDDILTNPGYYI